MKESLTGLSVVWLINLGRLFETMTINRSRAAIKDLLDLTPEDAWLVSSEDKSAGIPEKTLVHKIQKGDIIRVFSSERVPLDGKIVKGRAAVQESYLTGEPIAKEKSESDFIYAGSMIESGEIDLLVENLATETVMAKMIHSVEKMRENKAPIEKFGTKLLLSLFPSRLQHLVLFTSLPEIGSEQSHPLLLLVHVLLAWLPRLQCLLLLARLLKKVSL